MKKELWRIKLKRWREKMDLNQDELAGAAGVSQSLISQLESGPRDSFTLEKLGKVLKVFKKTYGELFCMFEPAVCPLLDKKEVKVYLIENRRESDDNSFNPKEHRNIPSGLSSLLDPTK